MRIWYKCDGSESRKNILDGARLNPKHYDNRQSAAKSEKKLNLNVIDFEVSTSSVQKGETLY